MEGKIRVVSAISCQLSLLASRNIIPVSVGGGIDRQKWDSHELQLLGILFTCIINTLTVYISCILVKLSIYSAVHE